MKKEEEEKKTPYVMCLLFQCGCGPAVPVAAETRVPLLIFFFILRWWWWGKDWCRPVGGLICYVLMGYVSCRQSGSCCLALSRLYKAAENPLMQSPDVWWLQTVTEGLCVALVHERVGIEGRWAVGGRWSRATLWTRFLVRSTQTYPSTACLTLILG